MFNFIKRIPVKTLRRIADALLNSNYVTIGLVAVILNGKFYNGLFFVMLGTMISLAGIYLSYIVDEIESKGKKTRKSRKSRKSRK